MSALFVPTEAQRTALDHLWRRYDRAALAAAEAAKPVADTYPTILHGYRVRMPKTRRDARAEAEETLCAARRAIEDMIIANERGFDSIDEARTLPTYTNNRRSRRNA